MADLVDLEGRDEMLDDAPEDAMEGEDNAGQKLKSTVEGTGKKQKGRGHTSRNVDDRYGGARFDQLGGGNSGPGPARSVEGWIVIVSNVHEEAQEDDIHEAFAEYGEIKNMHLNLDRRTGFVKGYALVEYDKKKEASDAISAMNGAELLTQNLIVDWAFSGGPLKKGHSRRPISPPPPPRELVTQGAAVAVVPYIRYGNTALATMLGSVDVGDTIPLDHIRHFSRDWSWNPGKVVCARVRELYPVDHQIFEALCALPYGGETDGSVSAFYAYIASPGFQLHSGFYLAAAAGAAPPSR